MPKLHRFDDPIDYHRGAKASPQPEKQHFPAFITAQGLHRRIVDEFQRTSEHMFKAKAYPTWCEIRRFSDRTVVERGTRIANRNHVVLPIAGEFINAIHHIPRCHGRSGKKFPSFGLSVTRTFSAYVDNEHIHAIFSDLLNVVPWNVSRS